LALIREKYLNGDYGQCPRILCNKQTVLPYGISFQEKYSRVNVSLALIRFSARTAKRFTSQGAIVLK